MARVRTTKHLLRFFPDLQPGYVPGKTVAEVVRALNARYPGLADYLVTEHGALRTHVNVFVSGRLVRDRTALTDQVADEDDVFIVQALSGGA